MRICSRKAHQANDGSAFLVSNIGFAAVCILSAVMSGCARPPAPYVRAYRETPKQVRCFDGVPHIPGSRPWILGGACCCTPTDELMEKYHADNVCTDLDTEGLIKLYHDQGIQLATDHQHCNNLCESGPHVTKGGKCMVPPTPGTQNYEEILTGIVIRPSSQPAKKE